MLVARDCGVSKQRIVYAYRNQKTRIVRRKEDSRFLGLSGWIADIHSKFRFLERLHTGHSSRSYMLQAAAEKIKG